jgi:hypothetical protein
METSKDRLNRLSLHVINIKFEFGVNQLSGFSAALINCGEMLILGHV